MTQFELDKKIIDLRKSIDEYFENSWEKAVVLTKLDEARLWLNEISIETVKI